MTLTHYRSNNMPIEERVGYIQDMVWKSVQDPRFRKFALSVTKHCPSRDGECEAKAIFDYVYKNVRYTGDIAPVKMGRNGPVEGIDYFPSAKRVIEFGAEDCLPAGTLLLTEGHKLTPIEDIIPGERIWGLNEWSTVENAWYKGIKPVDAIQLNNGSWFKATAEHKVYVAICDRHNGRKPETQPCSCPIAERRVERIAVSELQPKMVMLTPDRIPFGRNCGEWFVADHGGLGKNPVWRLAIREDVRSDGKAEKLLRVREILRNVGELPVYDISTSDHYVYLPEADVTVSNCDGHNIALATMLALNGITPLMRVTAPTKRGPDQHIYTVAKLPKSNPNRLVPMDTTLPNAKYGYELRYGRKRDFAA